MLKFLSLPDLYDRWCYTKAGIHKLARRKDFPLPVAVVNRGKIRVYTEESIQEYEKDKPWLFDENQKLRRQNLYLKLQTVKQETDSEKKSELLQKLFGESIRLAH